MSNRGRSLLHMVHVDGQIHRSHVDGVLEKQGALAYLPQGPGRSPVGVRSILFPASRAPRCGRISRRAPAPLEFMKVPASLASAQQQPDQEV